MRPDDDAVPTTPPSSIGETPFQVVPEALGLPPLRSVTLPPGYREVPIGGVLSMFAGSVIPMLRVVQGPERARGELIHFWSHVDWRPVDAASCIPDRHGLVICAMTVATAPMDWNVVAARLDRLGVWQLAERCEDGRRIIDGDDPDESESHDPHWRERNLRWPDGVS